MLSIGEFSLVSQLSIKTLRFYHELGILYPRRIDKENGYRYYDERNLEEVDRIKRWKEMGFTLKELQQCIAMVSAEEEEKLIRKKELELQGKMDRLKEQFQALQNWKSQPLIQDRNLPEPMEKQIAPLRYLSEYIQGAYHHIRMAFGKLYRQYGPALKGPAFVLYHDQEYRETDARMEGCSLFVPGKLPLSASPREHHGGKAVCIQHIGPYDTLGNSYNRLFQYCQEKDFTILSPHREIYFKGPGQLPPEEFETEIQLWVK